MFGSVSTSGALAARLVKPARPSVVEKRNFIVKIGRLWIDDEGTSRQFVRVVTK